MSDQAAPTKDQIVALEKSYWDAMKRKDGRRAAELSGETSLVVGAQGMMSISKDRMGQMTQSGDRTLESYDFEKIEVTIPAPNVAIVAYMVNQKVKMNGQSQDMRAADSSTWIRGPGGWECHAHSETVLKGKPA